MTNARRLFDPEVDEDDAEELVADTEAEYSDMPQAELEKRKPGIPRSESRRHWPDVRREQYEEFMARRDEDQ